MLIKAEQKFARISPRKVRLVAGTIQGLSLSQAQDQLQALNQRAVVPLKKTLRQAVANAINNHGLPETSLAIKEIQVGPGPSFKRWQPVSRGRAHPIIKRTSHIRIILESKDDSNPKPQIPENPPDGGHGAGLNPKQITKSQSPKSKKSSKRD